MGVLNATPIPIKATLYVALGGQWDQAPIIAPYSYISVKGTGGYCLESEVIEDARDRASINTTLGEAMVPRAEIKHPINACDSYHLITVTLNKAQNTNEIGALAELLTTKARIITPRGSSFNLSWKATMNSSEITSRLQGFTPYNGAVAPAA